MASDAFNSLTHRVLTLPKRTAEIHFSSPAHSPHYPPTGTGGRAHPRESRTVLIGSYRFQVVPICSNMFQCVPIVSSSRENANACQHTPEVPRACECIV